MELRKVKHCGMQGKTSRVLLVAQQEVLLLAGVLFFHLAVFIFPLIHNLLCVASLFIDRLPQHYGCGPAHVQPYWILAAPILIACSIWRQNFQVHVSGSWL